MGIFGFFNKNKKETLDKGLEKTKNSVFDKLARAIAGKSKVDDDVLDNLEEVLITSDVGVDTTLKIIQRIEERVARDKYVSTSELNGILRQEMAALLYLELFLILVFCNTTCFHHSYQLQTLHMIDLDKTNHSHPIPYQFFLDYIYYLYQ